MTHHLGADDLVDVLESRASSRATLHADQCGDCQARVRELAAMLQAVAAVDVPEPSPLFWDHLSRRVRDAVAEEPPPRPGAFGLWRWPLRFALPAVAMTAVIAALVGSVAVQRDRLSSIPSSVEVAALLEELDTPIETQNADPAWDLVMAVAADTQWDDFRAEGLVRAGDADEGLLQLSVDERQELARLLNEALRNIEAS